MKTYDFYCETCAAWFEAFSDFSATLGGVLPAAHNCGRPAKQKWRPLAAGGKPFGIRSAESIPPQLRKEFERSEGFVPETRQAMDSYMAERNLDFVSSDEHRRHYRPGNTEAALPPDTDDAQKVREWNRQRYGEDYVAKVDEESMRDFEMMEAGRLPTELPRGDSGPHETPHIVDPEAQADALTKSDPLRGVTMGLDANFQPVMPVRVAE